MAVKEDSDEERKYTLLWHWNLRRGTAEQKRWANASNAINTDCWQLTRNRDFNRSSNRQKDGAWEDQHACSMNPRNPQNVDLLNDDYSWCPNAGDHKFSQNLWAISKFQAPEVWQEDSSILDDLQLCSDLLGACWQTHKHFCVEGDETVARCWKL